MKKNNKIIRENDVKKILSDDGVKCIDLINENHAGIRFGNITR